MIALYITKKLVDFCRHDINNLVIILELLTSQGLGIALHRLHLICQTGKKMMYQSYFGFSIYFEFYNLQAKLLQMVRRHDVILVGPMRMRKQNKKSTYGTNLLVRDQVNSLEP